MSLRGAFIIPTFFVGICATIAKHIVPCSLWDPCGKQSFVLWLISGQAKPDVCDEATFRKGDSRIIHKMTAAFEHRCHFIQYKDIRMGYELFSATSIRKDLLEIMW